jgi:hypothetical protein
LYVDDKVVVIDGKDGLRVISMGTPVSSTPTSVRAYAAKMVAVRPPVPLYILPYSPNHSRYTLVHQYLLCPKCP